MTKLSEETLRHRLDKEGYTLRRKGDRYMVLDHSHGGTVHAATALDDPYSLSLEDVQEWLLGE